MDEGRLWMVAKEYEGESSFKSLEELHAALSASRYWRAHRSHLVNIEHIREIVPWFKSTYQIRMNDRKGTVIPVSRAQTKRLKELFNL
jgi:two-component system LytT family response regulator/two-component system response regulator LytT